MTAPKTSKVPEKSRANLTGGSRKGKPNKNTKALKDMILGALAGAGGEKYLQTQAKENPKAFLSLLGRVLPTEVKADVSGGLTVILKQYGPDRTPE